MRITWNELTVDFEKPGADDLLSDWRWLVGDSMRLLLVSSLGNMFLADSADHVFWLDTGTGQLQQIAESVDEFQRLRQQREQADEWFIPQLVGELDQVVSELLLEIPTLKHPEYCYRLYRADIIGKRDGQPQISEVTVGGREVLDWKSAVPVGVTLDAPMVWYGIEFEVSGAPPDERALINWTTRWMDISDSRLDDSTEFQQVVHSVTPPQITDSGFTISVDCGSAPTTAFDELIQLLVREARRVSVGSFFLSRSTV